MPANRAMVADSANYNCLKNLLNLPGTKCSSWMLWVNSYRKGGWEQTIKAIWPPARVQYFLKSPKPHPPWTKRGRGYRVCLSWPSLCGGGNRGEIFESSTLESKEVKELSNKTNPKNLSTHSGHKVITCFQPIIWPTRHFRQNALIINTHTYTHRHIYTHKEMGRSVGHDM